MRILAIVALSVLLAGCAARVRGTGEAYLSDQEIEAKDDATCKGFGAQPGTQIYIDCRLRLRSTRSSEDGGRRLRAAL